VGKSTQVKALAAALRERGIEVVETREPGGSPGAEAIRTLLLDGTEDQWTAETEALLFAAARADHVAKTIEPALAGGQWVLSDRFLDSSLAYQGGAGGLGIAAVRAINELGCGGVLPDRTLVLVAEEGAGRARARDGANLDRIGGRDQGYHAAVDEAFRQLANAEPERVRLVDASGAPDEVTKRLLAELADMLP
jgi:dTMP kinase